MNSPATVVTFSCSITSVFTYTYLFYLWGYIYLKIINPSLYGPCPPCFASEECIMSYRKKGFHTLSRMHNMPILCFPKKTSQAGITSFGLVREWEIRRYCRCLLPVFGELWWPREAEMTEGQMLVVCYFLVMHSLTWPSVPLFLLAVLYSTFCISFLIVIVQKWVCPITFMHGPKIE